MASHDTESIHSLPDAPSVQQGHRSYKRKFAKLKIKFEHAMKESNAHVKEELRIVDLAKRLKEQNDQLLELLLEMNSSVRVPPHLRYKLDVPSDSPQGPEGPPPFHCDPGTARERLREAKDSLLAGQISPEWCKQLEDSMLRGDQLAPSTDFSSLLKVPHTELVEPTVAEDDVGSALGFLSPAHETECSGILDAGTAIIPPAGERRSSIDRDKEAAFRNPVSVFNWLKKHQPTAFQQDAESVSEKPAPRSSTNRTSKRAAAQVQREEELYDEDGILLDAPLLGGTGNRGKRKRDEDGGYRPKGGSSGRSKKKKDDAATKRTKRSSAAGSTA